MKTPMTGCSPWRNMAAMTNDPIHPAVRVGHVHLRVVDLDRSLAFYRDALGFGVTADGRPLGLPAVFLAAGDYHHHIGLNTFAGAGAPPPDPDGNGVELYYDRPRERWFGPDGEPVLKADHFDFHEILDHPDNGGS